MLISTKIFLPTASEGISLSCEEEASIVPSSIFATTISLSCESILLTSVINEEWIPIIKGIGACKWSIAFGGSTEIKICCQWSGLSRASELYAHAVS